MDTAHGETAASLIATAAERGHRVTPVMLKKWRDAGLLPRPVQRPLGRGRGTVAVYPAGSTAQLLRNLAIRAEGGRFNPDRALWRLWWEGWRVDPARVLALLRARLLECERALATLEAEGGIHTMAAAGRLPSTLAKARKRAGRSGLRGLVDVIYGMMQGGNIGAWRLEEANLYATLGLADLHRSLPADEGQKVTGDIARSLSRFATATSPAALRAALNDAGDDEIAQARTDLRALAGAAAAFWPVVAPLLPAGNAVLDLLAQLEREYPDLLPVATLYALALGRHQTYAAFFDALADAAALAGALAQAIASEHATDKKAPPRPLERSGGMAQGKDASRCAPSLPPPKASSRRRRHRKTASLS